MLLRTVSLYNMSLSIPYVPGDSLYYCPSLLRVLNVTVFNPHL
jgi:hypothetical protein